MKEISLSASANNNSILHPVHNIKSTSCKHFFVYKNSLHIYSLGVDLKTPKHK